MNRNLLEACKELVAATAEEAVAQWHARNREAWHRYHAARTACRAAISEAEAFAAVMAQARKRLAKMDAIDRSAGAAAPHETPPAVHLGAAMQAVSAGIQTQDWPTVAEGLGLLEQLLARLR